MTEHNPPRGIKSRNPGCDGAPPSGYQANQMWTHFNTQYPTLNFQPGKDWIQLGHWIFGFNLPSANNILLRWSSILNPGILVATEHNPPEAGKPSIKPAPFWLLYPVLFCLILTPDF